MIEWSNVKKGDVLRVTDDKLVHAGPQPTMLVLVTGAYSNGVTVETRNGRRWEFANPVDAARLEATPWRDKFPAVAGELHDEPAEHAGETEDE